MNAIKLLAIITVTAAVTLLCIRSGQAMAKNLVPAETVYHPTDGKPEFHGKLLTVTTASTMTSTVASSTNNSSYIHFNTSKTTNPIVKTMTFNDESTTTVALNVSETVFRTAVVPNVTKNYSEYGTNLTVHSGEREQTFKNITSRALIGGVRHEDRSSRSRTSPIEIRGKLIKNIPHQTDRYGENSMAVAVDDDVEKEDDNDGIKKETNIKVDTEVYHAKRYDLI